MPDVAIIPEEAMATLSGLDQLRGILDGRFAQPSMGATLGFRLVSAAEVTPSSKACPPRP